MRTRPVFLIGQVLGFLAAPAALAQNEPLSAIDWLSNSVATAPDPAGHRAVVTNALPPTVRVAPLSQTRLDAVGLQPGIEAGLSDAFWGTASTTALIKEIAALDADLPLPLSRLAQRIVMAEIAPPIDASTDGALFVARIDYLLRIGALDKAQALLDRAGPATPEIARRAFDTALLSGRDGEACALPATRSDRKIALTPEAMIFCHVHVGDWRRADADLSKAREQGQISNLDARLLERFLHPELFEDSPRFAVPAQVTPLVFRLHQGIGEPVPLTGLPNAFLYSALDSATGWKTRLRAAERLARSGAISPSQLLAIYSERQAAASGGVWERVIAVQSFEAALKRGTSDRLDAALYDMLDAFTRADLLGVLGDQFSDQLRRAAFGAEPRRQAAQLLLLSDSFDRLPPEMHASTRPLQRAILDGDFGSVSGKTRMETAIIAGLRGDGPELGTDPKSPGLDVLRALRRLAPGRDTDPAELRSGLATLVAHGLTRDATKLALHLLAPAP